MRSILLTLLAAAGLAAASDEAKLRRLMVDSRFLQIISPCKTGGTNRNNAAEWLRTAFHDSINYDAAAGTGGIDASLQYELGYADNVGVAFPSVITQYKFYQQEDVSLADIVALGAIVAVGSCGGPMVPFYYGRTDAPGAGGEGLLPQPAQSTEKHMEIFARMGFSQSETIALVACGHTLGGVHANINGALTSKAHAGFDDTMTAFDNRIAVQHMNDTRLNPLGQAYDPSNPGTSSDARLFASDGNTTIKSFADSADTFQNGCKAVFSKMFNAVPSSVTLSGPLEPFPVSATFRLSLRNGVLRMSIGSARVYDMVGQWKSFDVSYTNRDGSIPTENTLTVRDLTTLSIGKPVEVRNFISSTAGFPPATGIGSLVITLTMNDGLVYSSPEGEEVIKVDDSIMVDVAPAFTCKYSGDGNNNANGLNVTMAVLGPYNPADKVSVIVRTNSGGKTLLAANYRGARDAYYNLYNLFIPDIDAIDLMSYGAQIVRADGSVSKDTQDDVYYKTSTLSSCLAGAEIPTPGPVPSAALARRAAARKLNGQPCPSGFSSCNNRCVNTWSDIEHCGGCADAGGVDCTALYDGAIACIAGKCVRQDDGQY